MAKVTEISGENFGLVRPSIPTRPTNNIPPFAEGMHLYLPLKYSVATEAEGVTVGIIQDPWGDESTDFRQIAGFGRPNQIAGGAAMGTLPILQWVSTPTPRVGFKQVVDYPSERFSLHFVYTVNGVIGGSGNRCLFSLIGKNLDKFLCFYATSSSEGPPRITTGFGAVTPLSSNAAITGTNYNLTFGTERPLAANQKEALSFVYDGTEPGGAVYVYRNSALINTFSSIGDFTLEGEAFLGVDARSGTNASDFKGEMGISIIDENFRSAADIPAIHTYLNKAFS